MTPGQVAFETYSAQLRGLSHDEAPTLPWAQLPDGVRAGWEAAAAAIVAGVSQSIVREEARRMYRSVLSVAVGSFGVPTPTRSPGTTQ